MQRLAILTVPPLTVGLAYFAGVNVITGVLLPLLVAVFAIDLHWRLRHPRCKGEPRALVLIEHSVRALPPDDREACANLFRDHYRASTGHWDRLRLVAEVVIAIPALSLILRLRLKDALRTGN
jgi:hypothetical protein